MKLLLLLLSCLCFSFVAEAKNFDQVKDGQGYAMNGCFVNSCWTTPFGGTNYWCFAQENKQMVQCVADTDCDYYSACHVQGLKIPRLAPRLAAFFSLANFQDILDMLRTWSDRWAPTLCVLGMACSVLPLLAILQHLGRFLSAFLSCAFSVLGAVIPILFVLYFFSVRYNH